MEKLEALILAVCEVWGKDPTQPSVILSYLPKEACWYGSIARYAGRYTTGKMVVCKATGEDTLEKAVKKLTKEFLTYIGRGERVDNLVESLKR